MKKIFAANWKLHKSPKDTRDFFRAWISKVPAKSDRLFVFFPSAISLEAASQELNGTATEWGGQNCYFEEKGAFTGENSPAVLKELGARWCLVGHSERRAIFGEADDLLAKKVRKLQDLGLTPLLCIGEQLQERESNRTLEVLSAQLKNGLAQVDPSKPVALAYEPVWAIGTGKVAGPEQVKEAHAFIHQEMQKWKLPVTTPILYGGSVKPDNAGALIQIPHVDGFLVGGASLEVDSFLGIAGS